MAKARKYKDKHNNAPTHKDDGTRWLIVRAGVPVYGSRAGTTRAEAERLLDMLLEPAELIQINLA